MHFRIDNICLMMYNMINHNNHVANATLLFNLFTYANDTTNIFNKYIYTNIIIIIFFNDREYFIVSANRASINNLKTMRNFD